MERYYKLLPELWGEDGGRTMTNQEATAIIKNLKSYLKNEDKVKDKKLHKDVYVALDMAMEAMEEKK